MMDYGARWIRHEGDLGKGELEMRWRTGVGREIRVKVAKKRGVGIEMGGMRRLDIGMELGTFRGE